MKINKSKKGISLIVLVITIIVMIILATAIILSLNSSNMTGKANEAKNSNDYASYKEAYQIAQSDLLVKGVTDQEEILKKAYPNVAYSNNFAEVHGKVVYIGEDENLKAALFDNDILSMKPEIVLYARDINDTSLILNNGYMTGLSYKDDDGEYNPYTVNELLAKLPAGSTITKFENGQYKNLGGNEYVGTGNIIVDSDWNHIAYTVYFGDLNGPHEETGTLITDDDITDVEKIYKNNIDPFIGYEAADANDDGYINEKDKQLIQEVVAAINIIDQHRPVRLKLKW